MAAPMDSTDFLLIDIETRSHVDLKRSGIYRYAWDKSTEILLFGYSIGGAPPVVIDTTAGEHVPPEVIDLLLDPSVPLVAHNAAFERVVLAEKLMLPEIRDPRRWFCTSYAARCFGMPASLEMIGLWLGAEKDMAGHRLMMKFCKPDRDGNWRQPTPEEWERFKAYCARDVDVEAKLWAALPELPFDQWCVYWDNEAINDRGVRVDQRLARTVIDHNSELVLAATERWGQITGLASWRQTEAVRQWISRRIGEELPDIRRETLEQLLERDDLPPDVREAIEIRLTHGRAATAKFQTALDMVGWDGRLRGLYVAHAAITGRYSSRGVQLHNLRRDCAKEEQISAWLNGNGPMPDPGTMVRALLIPENLELFLVSDYSQIEARITAWLAGEQALLDTFASGDDVYLRTYERAFGLPLGSLNKNDNPAERFIGKTMALGCGFGAGVKGVRTAMGRRGDQFTDDQIQNMVFGYRRAYPRIPALWRTLRTALLSLFYARKQTERVELDYTTLVFRRQGAVLAIQLPSGRELIYQGARLEEDGETVTYARPNRKPKQDESEWPRAPLSGPALIENIVQAIANDCLRAAIRAAHRHPVFNHVVGHTHDELIVEVQESLVQNDAESTIMRFEREVMRAVEQDGWSRGLPLACETKLMRRYGK